MYAFVIYDSGPPPPTIKGRMVGGSEKNCQPLISVPSFQLFIGAWSLFNERTIIFSWKLGINAFCGSAQAFPIFITKGLDIKPFKPQRYGSTLIIMLVLLR
jgi:hypothetical protein